jgi:hypothetical protein
VFPNANVNSHSPGVTQNLVIKYKDTVVFDRKAGSGYLSQYNASDFANKLKTEVAASS